jgi:hypothetical protein
VLADGDRDDSRGPDLSVQHVRERPAVASGKLKVY